jgi:hypothetical protein
MVALPATTTKAVAVARIQHTLLHITYLGQPLLAPVVVVAALTAVLLSQALAATAVLLEEEEVAATTMVAAARGW